MCGIAGIIHKGDVGDVGREMAAMLQSLKHRGPDSSGFALYGTPEPRELVMRLKLAEREDVDSGTETVDAIDRRRDEVEGHLAAAGAEILDSERSTEYAFRYQLAFDGDIRALADAIESVDGAQILSLGTGLELVKDLGDAEEVSDQYELDKFRGTHAIGHVRMATESDVDIRSAHPYWAYPFLDISVVHNGQLTNYWSKRRALERHGAKFQSDCDSELIAVFLAAEMNAGLSFEEALHKSLDEFDGVFTFLVATDDALGMVKDRMAAKPMVLYESETLIALASEEVAIRSIFPDEIDTADPYAGEVLVWQK